MLFVRCTTSMNLVALVDCHRQAFADLGGWTREILYDNRAQVRIGPGRWNEGFLDFARHYGFTPRMHRPYRPRTKGKIERAVEHVRDSFLHGRSFADVADLNVQVRGWLAGTANTRVHATTGHRPVDLLPQETLTPVNTVPADQFRDPVRRTVSFESIDHFRGSRYSVPPVNAGQAVEVVAAGGQIVIRVGDTVVAEPREGGRPGQYVVAREHLEELWKVTAEQIQPPPVPPRSPAASWYPTIVPVTSPSALYTSAVCRPTGSVVAVTSPNVSRTYVTQSGPSDRRRAWVIGAGRGCRRVRSAGVGRSSEEERSEPPTATALPARRLG
ncbi:MAG: transposase [Gemmataceae bacterium]|nr:transposase [Gemmataceae bacterium]